jgi:opacity protein-like surface antigen
MRTKTSLLITAVAASLLLAAAALAAYPKHPSKWVGGNGMGLPVTFKLNRHAHASSAKASFTCRSVSGIGTAGSKSPTSTWTKGKLHITYTSKVGSIGKVKVKWVISFPTKTSAKGNVTFTNQKCNAPKLHFTATTT